MSTASTFRESFRLLTSKRFGPFWFASLLSSLGTWAQQVAEPWLLVTLGASSFVIGLDSFAMNAPVWLLTVAGGVLADRSDRRAVITGFQSVQMLCPTAIALLLAFGTIRPWTIVALSIVVGVTDALSMPSFQSIVPSIVPREHLARGLALNSTQFNLSRILGPSLAGALMATVGPTACFVVSAISYVPFIGAALWVLPKRGSPSDAAREHETALRSPRVSLPQTMREIVRNDTLRKPLATVLTTSVFCSPLVTFAPVLVKDGFRGEAGHFFASVAAFGVGGVLGATALLGVSDQVNRRVLSAVFAVAYGLVTVLAAIVPWLVALPGLLVLAGACMTVSNTAANTELQRAAEQGVLGRTVSLFMLAMRGGISFGSLLAGATVGLFGVREALLVNGAIAIVLQLWLARDLRGLTPRKAPPRGSPESPSPPTHRAESP